MLQSQVVAETGLVLKLTLTVLASRNLVLSLVLVPDVPTD